MSRNNGGDADFWLSMPLRELAGWIEANNDIQAEAERRRKKK